MWLALQPSPCRIQLTRACLLPTAHRQHGHNPHTPFHSCSLLLSRRERNSQSPQNSPQASFSFKSQPNSLGLRFPEMTEAEVFLPSLARTVSPPQHPDSPNVKPVMHGAPSTLTHPPTSPFPFKSFHWVWNTHQITEKLPSNPTSPTYTCQLKLTLPEFASQILLQFIQRSLGYSGLKGCVGSVSSFPSLGTCLSVSRASLSPSLSPSQALVVCASYTGVFVVRLAVILSLCTLTLESHEQPADTLLPRDPPPLPWPLPPCK